MATNFLTLRNSPLTKITAQTINYTTLKGNTIKASTINVPQTTIALGNNTLSTITNSQGTWSNWISTGLTLSGVKQVAISTSGQYQLIVQSGTLYLSSNSGSSWSALPVGDG